MVERVSIWFAAGHSSVKIVAGGVARDFSGGDMALVLATLPSDERAALRHFVYLMAEALDGRPVSFLPDKVIPS